MALDYAFGVVSPIASMTVDTVQGAVGITSHTIGISGILVAGDPVQISGAWYIIAAVTGAFTADLNRAAESTLSGVPISWLQTTYLLYQVLGVPNPKSVFMPYSKQLPLGNGLVRGAGWATAEWRWGYVTATQRASLRTRLPGASAAVYLVTRPYEQSDAFQWYSGVGIWPQEEDRIIAAPQHQRQTFTIKFQKLIQLSAY